MLFSEEEHSRQREKQVRSHYLGQQESRERRDRRGGRSVREVSLRSVLSLMELQNQK